MKLETGLWIKHFDLKIPSPRRGTPVLMDVVQANLPAQLGLDVLESECLYADNVTIRIVHRGMLSQRSERLKFREFWRVPLIRDDWLLYLSMKLPTYTFYTSEQTLRFFWKFAHLPVSKLFKLIKSIGIELAATKSFGKIEEIVARYEHSQRVFQRLDYYPAFLQKM